MALITSQEALEYHSRVRPGKVEVMPVKPCRTQKDLSLAYSPGVADACMAIHADAALSYKYTGRGNLVGVVSNGTAVLGLGNIGPEAAKPVMEGKGVLFKVFADVDCYDINLAETDPDKFCDIVKAMEPTFGGINLEDIKAPECFYIEERLKKEMGIPVFHDDQHGTAVISGAGLLNALEISGKKVQDIRVVVSGAGAAAVACSRFYVLMGVPAANIAMFDSRGHVHSGRQDLSPEKREFAGKTVYKDMAEAFKGADVFLGLSKAGLVTQEMAASMAPNPVLFACANPEPEISYAAVKEVRSDAIMATGRSDCPNQINNVSGFPYIFRGALDVRASEITPGMRLAAAKAIAALAHEPVPACVQEAYGGATFSYGPDYIIPTPLDPRLLEHVAGAVAEAAIADGVAREIPDMAAYRGSLRKRMDGFKERAEGLLRAYGW